MGIESYLLIVLCYSIGCYLSFRIGFSRGMAQGIDMTVAEVAKLSNEPPLKIIRLIQDQRARSKRSRPAA